jgi:hypothetical protein
MVARLSLLASGIRSRNWTECQLLRKQLKFI